MLRMIRISQKPLGDETKLLMICGANTNRFYTSKVKLAWRMRKVMRKVMMKVTRKVMKTMVVIFRYNKTVYILHTKEKKYMQLL